MDMDILAIPDLKTFLHSELYEIVEEKSRDILEESGDLTWNIHCNVGNETYYELVIPLLHICNMILQLIQRSVSWNIHGNVGIEIFK